MSDWFLQRGANLNIVAKYRKMSTVTQHSGLVMDVAGLRVSVQCDMVKTHMATGRHTPPPQQHLLWLTIHSGKRRRLVVYTTQ